MNIKQERKPAKIWHHCCPPPPPTQRRPWWNLGFSSSVVFKCSQDYSIHYTQLLFRLHVSYDGSSMAIKVFISMICLSFKNISRVSVWLHRFCSNDVFSWQAILRTKKRYVKKKVKSKTLKRVVIQMVMTQVYSLGENELVTWVLSGCIVFSFRKSWNRLYLPQTIVVNYSINIRPV